MRLDQVEAARLMLQRFPMFGVRNGDEGPGTLAYGPTAKVRDSVLCHHKMNVAASCHHAGSRLQLGHDSRDAAVRCR